MEHWEFLQLVLCLWHQLVSLRSFKGGQTYVELLVQHHASSDRVQHHCLSLQWTWCLYESGDFLPLFFPPSLLVTKKPPKSLFSFKFQNFNLSFRKLNFANMANIAWSFIGFLCQFFFCKSMMSKCAWNVNWRLKKKPNYALEEALEWNDQVKLSPIIFSLRLI